MTPFLRISCFLFFACCFSCKHDPADIGQSILQLETHRSLIYEGDSFQLTLKENARIVTDGTSWSATDGTITSDGLFIAPESILTDTQYIRISASYHDQTITLVIPVTKKAFLDPPVSFSQTVLPVFVSNCNFRGCHGNGSHASNVELSCYDSVMNAVVPFAAINSRAYYALVKTDPIRIMPPAGKLHQDKIDAVWTWIEQGAQDN